MTNVRDLSKWVKTASERFAIACEKVIGSLWSGRILRYTDVVCGAFAVAADDDNGFIGSSY